MPALVAYRTRPTTFLAAATRMWPLAASAIFLVSGTSLGATPLHAFQGITLPLSVLAVEGLQLLGWRRLRHPALTGAAAVALFTIPATVKKLSIGHSLAAPTPENANFIKRDERRALSYLARNKELFAGQLRTDTSRRFVQESGVRFVLADCETTADMLRLLGPLVRSTHEFGCAAVYEVE